MCMRHKLTETNKTMSPRAARSPRQRPRELFKPKLSRKVVPSARVNLNLYWSAFEGISNQGSPVLTIDLSSTVDVLSNSMYSTFYDNEINENLINELIELGKL